MAERERRNSPPFGGVFIARTQVLDFNDVRRAVWRMANEIVEANHGIDEVVLIGLQTGGVPFAEEQIAGGLVRLVGASNLPEGAARLTAPGAAAKLKAMLGRHAVLRRK